MHQKCSPWFNVLFLILFFVFLEKNLTPFNLGDLNRSGSVVSKVRVNGKDDIKPLRHSSRSVSTVFFLLCLTCLLFEGLLASDTNTYTRPIRGSSTGDGRQQCFLRRTHPRASAVLLFCSLAIRQAIRQAEGRNGGGMLDETRCFMSRCLAPYKVNFPKEHSGIFQETLLAVRGCGRELVFNSNHLPDLPESHFFRSNYRNALFKLNSWA